MRLVNQLNSLKTATEFATLQGYGQCGSAALPAGVIDVFCPLSGSSVNRHFATDLEGSKSFSLLSGKLPHYIFALTPRPLYEIEI